ncbi:ABC transporter substrate-binding protein [uncultured Tateyamaria sp.]|uniref:ABC transporter substrate-binding protein n=1 Tax=uncultured Tateyamaria sp. TaxID=455651 RepID=UPI00262BCCB5|nr:ABC transporter substrate-binding protein [uncultured Tateyamaria sp.]
MKRRNMSLKGAIALAAALGVTAPAHAEGEIVVGHLTYHTGEFGAFGPFFDGVAEMVLSKINADPPLGMPMRAIHQDIGTVGEARAARKLVDSDGVQVLLNPAHSYLSYREFMLEKVAEQGLPIMPSVHGGAIEGTIGGVADEPIFRGSPLDTANGTAALLHVRDAGKKNVVIIATEVSGSQLQKEAAVRTAEAIGFEVLGDFDIQAGESNYRSVVSRIARLNPEAVVMFSSPQAGGSFVKNAAESGNSWYIVGSGEWQETEFYDTATQSALAQHEAVVLAANSHSDNPSFEPYMEFANASQWIDDIGDPSNSYAIQYYDLLVASALAIEKAGELNTASWTDAMYAVTGGEGKKVYSYEDGLAAIRAGEDINYDGVTGSMEYTDTGIVSGLFGIFAWQDDGTLSQIGSVDGDAVLELEAM